MEKTIEQEVKIKLTEAELQSKLKNKQSYLTFKRCIDFTAALVLLIILSPLWLLISIIIILESKGPALFKQIRVGKSGKEFTIYKFRSMSVGSPIRTSSDFNDCQPHITKFGNILRKTSLDEIPQLLNVIKGDMSLIGPRPVIPIEQDLISLRNENGSSLLLPGLTGWAQVNGRTKIDNIKKASYDEEYFEKISLSFDFKILLKTLKLLLRGGEVDCNN